SPAWSPRRDQSTTAMLLGSPGYCQRSVVWIMAGRRLRHLLHRLETTASSGSREFLAVAFEVLFGEQREPHSRQRGGGRLVVLDVQRQGGPAVRPDQQRVGVMDADLGA